MTLLRRIWRVYADPGDSHLASGLRLFIPMTMVAAVIGYVTGIPFGTLDTAVWLYVLLWVVRQRDEALARLSLSAPAVQEKR